MQQLCLTAQEPSLNEKKLVLCGQRLCPHKTVFFFCPGPSVGNFLLLYWLIFCYFAFHACFVSSRYPLDLWRLLRVQHAWHVSEVGVLTRATCVWFAGLASHSQGRKTLAICPKTVKKRLNSATAIQKLDFCHPHRAPWTRRKSGLTRYRIVSFSSVIMVVTQRFSPLSRMRGVAWRP